MIAHGLPIYVALEPVDMRLGAERLGAMVREKMRAEPRSRALFVFVGKRGHTMKVLTWDGTGTIVIHKKLDAGRFELPRATTPGEQHLPAIDDAGAIHDIQRFAHVVVGDQHADAAFLEIDHQMPDIGDRQWIDACERLIEQHDRWAGGQRAGNLAAPALAAGQ